MAPADIATAIVDEIENPSASNPAILYVASEELTCREVAGILGRAIGKPDLKWIKIPDQQMLDALTARGMKPDIAEGMVEMYSNRTLYDDYFQRRPVLGAPGQVFGPAAASEGATIAKMSGWVLYLHPDFCWNTPLAKKMRGYEYFDYSVHEALFLTEGKNFHNESVGKRNILCPGLRSPAIVQPPVQSQDRPFAAGIPAVI